MIKLEAGMTIETIVESDKFTDVKEWLLFQIGDKLIPREILAYSQNGWVNLGDFRHLDTLLPNITRVYKPEREMDIGDTDSSLLVWKKEVPEYTMKELESKLGHKFKIKN